jgi:hypothetical protein
VRPRWLSPVCWALAASFAAFAAPALAVEPPARWSGLDEAVIEKLAADAGRQPRPLLFELEGDLALFVFLSAGIVGGTVLGYCFRMVFVEQVGRRRSDGAAKSSG